MHFRNELQRADVAPLFKKVLPESPNVTKKKQITPIYRVRKRHNGKKSPSDPSRYPESQ